MSARVPDQPGLLYGMGLYRNGISSHPEHVGKKFLRQAECVASDHVLRLQEPAAKPTTDRMEGVAGSILLRLRQKYRLISID